MAESNEVIVKAFSRFLTGFSLSKAILEDYARVISKIEDVPEQEVIDRVKKRSDEIIKETQAKQDEDISLAKS